MARLDGRKRKKARAPAQADQPPALNDAQQAAVETLAALNGFKPVLLYGVTGSGECAPPSACWPPVVRCC